MTEPSSTNPGPSDNQVWSASMPKVDPIAHRQEDQTLRDQAHACGVFWDALLAEGVPEHPASVGLIAQGLVLLAMCDGVYLRHGRGPKVVRWTRIS